MTSGREAGVEADGGIAVDGQELAVAPHAVRARFDQLARNGVLDQVVVVVGLERTEVELADVDRLLGVLAAAFAALEIAEKFLAHNFHRLPRIDLDMIGDRNTRCLNTSRHSLLILPGTDRVMRTAPSWVWHLTAKFFRMKNPTRLPRFHRASPSTALDKLPVSKGVKGKCQGGVSGVGSLI